MSVLKKTLVKLILFLDVLEADTLAKLREGVHTNEGEEDCLDTMERKISEIMAKDSNRRQLQQQAAAAGGHNANDLRIMLGGGSRHQSGGGFGRGVQGHSAEVGDADAGSSSSGLDSSQENLSQSYWSDQDDNFVLRRRR